MEVPKGAVHAMAPQNVFESADALLTTGLAPTISLSAPPPDERDGVGAGLESLSAAEVPAASARERVFAGAIASGALHGFLLLAIIVWSQTVVRPAPEPIAVEVVAEQPAQSGSAAAPEQASSEALLPPSPASMAPTQPTSEPTTSVKTPQDVKPSPLATATPEPTPAPTTSAEATPRPTLEFAPAAAQPTPEASSLASVATEPSSTSAATEKTAPQPTPEPSPLASPSATPEASPATTAAAETTPQPTPEPSPPATVAPEPAPTVAAATQPPPEPSALAAAATEPTPSSTTAIPPTPQPAPELPAAVVAPSPTSPQAARPTLANASAAKASPPAKPKPQMKPAAVPRPAAAPHPATTTAALSSELASRASSASVGDYRNVIFARISEHTHYPEAALDRRAEGVARVSFSIDDAGRLTAVALAGSAGDPALDNDAPATVRRAAPFGPPPAGAPRSYVVPIRYRPQ